MHRSLHRLSSRLRILLLATVICAPGSFESCQSKRISTGTLPANWGVRKAVPFETIQKNFSDPDMIYAPFILGRDNEGDYGWGLAWSATLNERYRDRYGRDIRLWMPLSIERNVEGAFARARWEWFDFVSDIYAETFRAVTDWHEKRCMYTTAHFWEEGIEPQVSAVGDHLKMLRALTTPGQDCLGRKPLRTAFSPPAS